MKILVINAGSSSLKFQLIQMKHEECLCSGVVERIGDACSKITYKANGIKREEVVSMATHTDAFEKVMQYLLDVEVGVIKSV
ncbi:MAG: acetate kinase, partial [Clostridia bacterium]